MKQKVPKFQIASKFLNATQRFSKNNVRSNRRGRGIEAEEKRMFGGICFMVNDKMTIGISNKGYLMVRCLPEKCEQLLERDGFREMDFTGKPMKGFLFVDETGFQNDRQLADWIGIGIKFADAPAPAKKSRVKK